MLTWWQLRDRARDDRGWKGWTALLLAQAAPAILPPRGVPPAGL